MKKVYFKFIEDQANFSTLLNPSSPEYIDYKDRAKFSRSKKLILLDIDNFLSFFAIS